MFRSHFSIVTDTVHREDRLWCRTFPDSEEDREEEDTTRTHGPPAGIPPPGPGHGRATGGPAARRIQPGDHPIVPTRRRRRRWRTTCPPPPAGALTRPVRSTPTHAPSSILLPISTRPKVFSSPAASRPAGGYEGPESGRPAHGEAVRSTRRPIPACASGYRTERGGTVDERGRGVLRPVRGRSWVPATGSPVRRSEVYSDGRQLLDPAWPFCHSGDRARLIRSGGTRMEAGSTRPPPVVPPSGMPDGGE